MDVYLIRLIELFSGYWVVLFFFPFVFFIILVKRLMCKIKSYKNVTNKRIIKKIIENKSFKRIAREFLVISIIILSGIYYTLNYPKTSYSTRYYFTDSQTDVVLFAGNYFNENPLNTDIIILVQNQSQQFIRVIYALIEVENLNKLYYTSDNNSTHFLNYNDYIEFKEYVELMNVSYVLFNVVFTDEDFQTNLYSDINLFYRNEGFWIFGKIK